jgi:hypothetical protein
MNRLRFLIFILLLPFISQSQPVKITGTAPGAEGKKIEVITTLYPGNELSNLDPDGLLIKNIAAMSILAPEKQNEQTQQNVIPATKNINGVIPAKAGIQ